MAFTKLEPNSINTSATFTFANATITGTTNLGPASNVKITGGSTGQVLKTDGTGNLSWVDQSSGGGSGGGIALTDLSATTAAPGITDLNYNSSTGAFTYTPPDLSGYSTFSGSYTDLTNKPTLFSGSYTDLTNKPIIPTVPTTVSSFTNDSAYITASSLTWGNISSKPTFAYVSTSGSYTDLLNKPTIPTSLLDLNITDGVSGQVLTTDGTGNFIFTTVSSGGAGGGSSGYAGLTKDTFTGDNSTTTFQLSVTPAGKNYISVNIDGITQLSSAYTLAAANVTLLGTPATGEKIEITTASLVDVSNYANYAYVDSLAFTDAKANTAITNKVTQSFVNALNITTVGTLANLTMGGLLSAQQLSEAIATPSGSTYDFSTGGVFYTTSATLGANFTPNFTNVPVTDSRSTVVAIIINQGSTPYMPTATANIQIDGTNYAVKWGGGTTPTGHSNSIQTIMYSLLRVSSSWIVTGSSTSYY